MKRATRHLLRLFVTGLLAALPLAATVAIFAWAISLLLQWVGPSSAVGTLLSGIGLGVTGSEVVGYSIGIAIVVGVILLLGLLVELGLERGLAEVVDAVMQRIPIVRSVYDLVQRFVALMAPRGDDEGTRAMRAVWCHFGGREGPHSLVLGLQSAPDAVWVDGQRCLIVLVPTAPVPVGGGLIFVPEDWVSPADLSAEAITSLYVSMGVTAPQHLAAAPPRDAGKQDAAAHEAAARGSITP